MNEQEIKKPKTIKQTSYKKGVDTITSEVYDNFIITSGDSNSIAINSITDRRYLKITNDTIRRLKPDIFYK